MGVRKVAGGVYYFWDKKQNKLGSLIVTGYTASGFTFDYEGKKYRSTFAQAEGKLFRNDWDVPEYRAELIKLREQWQREREEQQRKEEERARKYLEAYKRKKRMEANYGVQTDPNTHVVFGD